MKVATEARVARHGAGTAVGSRPLELWHLLSLDAPMVAVVWTWFAARVNGMALPWTTAAAMGVAVWVLYAGDRLLDTRGDDPAGELEARHFFHHRHRFGFVGGIAVAAVALAWLLPRLDAASMRLYLAEGALVAGYFVVVHALPGRIRLPKELIVGPLFAAATFIPTVSRNPGLRGALLPDAGLLAALCCLNGLFIYRWEHPERQRMAGQVSAFGWFLVAAAGLVGTRDGSHFYAAACALSVLLLLALDRVQHRISQPSLRAAGDVALLTPLLLLPVFRYFG